MSNTPRQLRPEEMDETALLAWLRNVHTRDLELETVDAVRAFDAAEKRAQTLGNAKLVRGIQIIRRLVVVTTSSEKANSAEEQFLQALFW